MYNVDYYKKYYHHTCTGISIVIEIGATFQWPVASRSDMKFHTNNVDKEKIKSSLSENLNQCVCQLTHFSLQAPWTQLLCIHTFMNTAIQACTMLVIIVNCSSWLKLILQFYLYGWSRDAFGNIACWHLKTTKRMPLIISFNMHGIWNQL